MLLKAPLTRTSAAAWQLLISLVLVGLLATLALVSWFPGPLFQLDGGWQGLQLIAALDLILGPLLTLVVFRPGKPGLAFDMAVITAVRVAVLCYGAWTLFDNRPVLLVFADDHMQPLPRSVVAEIDPSGTIWQRFRGPKPVSVALAIPTDPLRAPDYVLGKLKSGTPLHLHHRDYVPLTDHWSAVIADSLDINHYVSHRPDWRLALQLELARLSRDRVQLVFLPLKGRNGTGILLADAASGEFVGHLDIPFHADLARKRLLFKERLQRHFADHPEARTRVAPAPAR
jgi:hypothetical protein